MSRQMFRPLLFLVLFAAIFHAVFSLPALANPISYTISFSYTSISNLYDEPSILPPLTASFNYDPASGFSDFLVNWYGLSMDLTSEANNPGTSSSYTSPPDCGMTTLTGHALGFAMLSNSLPTDCPDNLHTQFWNGELDKEYGYIRTFGFIYRYGEYVDKYSGLTDWAYTHGIFGDARGCDRDIKACLPLGDIFAVGNWSITAQSVPEPGTLLLLGSGLVGIVVLRKKFKA